MQSAPVRMRWTLIAAGVYNLLWGAWVVLRPLDFFNWVGLPEPTYPQIWQCVGMIVGVYGVGYLAAARDPLRHWPIVLVGFLGKLLGPIGFTQAVITGAFPLAAAWTIVTNDLIWWVPFGWILLSAWSSAKQPAQVIVDNPRERAGESA